MASQSFWILNAAAVAACAMASHHVQAAMVYSLASDGTALIRFDSATPGTVTTVGTIAGSTTRLDGLDFRPSNGLLYGYSDTTNSIYTVNTSTGAVTFASTLTTGTTTNFLGIDFNPAADRLRIVNNQDQNLRVNVATGGTTVDGTLAYAPGDANAGVNPDIVDAAYINSSLGAAPATTALYYIDYSLNTLVSTSNPNGGVLSTVGALGFDFTANSGFDIFSSGGSDFAYGALRVNDVNNFYSISLATGAASLVGAIGDTSFMYGLAIAPGDPAAVVPEPGSLALLGAAGLAALTARRRQSAAPTRTA